MDPFTLFMIISGVSQVASLAQQQKSYNLQKQQQNVRANQERRQSLRQAQIARAQAQVAAQAAGAQGGSAIGGGLASLGSQVGANLGYQSQMSGISRGITSAEQSAAMFSGISQFAGGMAPYFTAQQPAQPTPNMKQGWPTA